MALELVTIPCLADNYCFLMHCSETGDTAVIDVPEAAPVSAALRERGWALTHVLLTHHHYDHIDGLEELKAEYPDAVVIGAEADAHRLPPLDLRVKEGDTITIGNLTGRVVEMRGHSPCGIAIIFENEKVVISGDALFAGSVGRADLEGGDMQAQVRDIREKLLVLDDETVVCPGHGPTTTVGREKRFNPYF